MPIPSKSIISPQVEGVIADVGLTLGDLIGVLYAFFKKLGIEKLRFKPAYNPYTEPSMEIFRSVEVSKLGPTAVLAFPHSPFTISPVSSLLFPLSSLLSFPVTTKG